jgi:hypothetical protein
VSVGLAEFVAAIEHDGTPSRDSKSVPKG